MPQPYDYSLKAADPTQAFVEGLQLSNGLQQMQQQRAQQQMQQQVITSLLANPNPGADDYARATLIIPGMREHFKQAWDMHNTDQQQASLQQIGQVHAALSAGQPQVASDILRRRAEALKNSNGPADQIQAAQSMADVIDQHPQFARTMTGMQLASIPGGDKVLSNLATMGQEDRTAAEFPAKLRTANAEAAIKEAAAAAAPQKEQQALQTSVWNNANTRSQIQERSARLGLDRDRLTSETQVKLAELNQKFGQLPDDARTLVNSSAVSAVASEQATSQYQSLAGQLDQQVAAGAGYGTFSTAQEWLKGATGNQDALTGLRQEYTRLMSQGVMKMLPPGPASDKDVALAREGFPKANADAAYLANFLRGMAKISAFDAVLNNAKAEWVGAVQHLGRTKTDIEIDGTKVPAGTTFNEFARQYMAQRADQLNTAAMIGSRGYMKFAAPQTGGATGSY